MLIDLFCFLRNIRYKAIYLILISFVSLVSISSTCLAPAITAYHEDLPAYVPKFGIPESRFGYHRVFWSDGFVVRPAEYFNLGLRTGEHFRSINFEQGFISTIFRSNARFGIGCGIGVKSPAITLRGIWQPFEIIGRTNIGGTNNQLEFNFKADKWWQASLLGGTGSYQTHGIGWAAGGRISKLGIGPILMAEYGSGILSLRAEISATFVSPWATPGNTGQCYSIGIGAVHHGRTPR